MPLSQTMSSQRYQRVASADDSHHHDSISTSQAQHLGPQQIPSSPPPSFRSRASSISQRRSDEHEPLFADANTDTALADAFDSPSDSEEDDHNAPQLDDRQRVLSGRPAGSISDDSNSIRNEGRQAVVTQLPAFPPATSTRVYGGGNSVHDGVFANLSAKPEQGDNEEEKPPSYEQAAADATPPYWENTILAPGGSGSDEVYIDGLPVGSLFSFVWNGMISMSFQLVGFLLTYLLHTTHAAKNGSKAGLGITLVHYGFTMKGSSSMHPSPDPSGNTGQTAAGPSEHALAPAHPNNHEFGSGAPTTTGAAFIPSPTDISSPRGSAHNGGLGGLQASDWFAYALMIVGWFVLIRAISEYLKARKHETIIMQTPSRGLTVPIVPDDEDPERAV